MEKAPSKLETLKEQGNTLFRQGQYAKAMECYQQGLDSVNCSEEMQCLFNGNLSQALFQLGRYDLAYEKAKLALDSGLAKDPAKIKNRAMMSLMLASRYNECREQFGDVEEMMDALDAKANLTAEHKRMIASLSMCRQSPSLRQEYYWYGNEDATSYLREPKNAFQAKRPFTPLPSVSRSCIAGSSGDGRHVLATLYEFVVHSGREGQMPASKKKGHTIAETHTLELEVVDWEPRTATRSMLLFILIQAYGLARKEECEPRVVDEIFQVFWYLLFSFGIPRTFVPHFSATFDSLSQAMEPSATLPEQHENEDSNEADEKEVTHTEQVLKLIHRAGPLLMKSVKIAPNSVPQVREVMADWKSAFPHTGSTKVPNMIKLSVLKHVEQFRKQTTERLTEAEIYKNSEIVSPTGLGSMDAMGHQTAQENFDGYFTDARCGTEKSFSITVATYFPDIEYLVRPGICSVVVPGQFAGALQDGRHGDYLLKKSLYIDWQKTTLKEMRAFTSNRFKQWIKDTPFYLVDAWSICVNLHMANSFPIIAKVCRVQHILGVTVPDCLRATDPPEQEETFNFITKHPPQFPNLETIDIKALDQNYFVNPTAPIYVNAATGERSDYTETSQTEFGRNLAEFVGHVALDLYDHCAEEHHYRPTGGVGLVNAMLAPISEALYDCGTDSNGTKLRIQVTFHCSDLQSFALQRQMDKQEKENKKFNTVRVSNIPDYYGLLNTFLCYLPLLAENGKGCISHEILYTTTLYPTFDSMVRGALCFSRGSPDEYRMLRVDCEATEVYSRDILWKWTNSSVKAGKDPQELITWIHRVFRFATETPGLEMGTSYNEILPCTIATVFHCVAFLVGSKLLLPHLAYHIVDQFLKVAMVESAVESPKFLTKAKAPTASPVPYVQEGNEADIKDQIRLYRYEIMSTIALLRPLLPSIALPPNRRLGSLRKVTFILRHVLDVQSLPHLLLPRRFPQGPHDFHSSLGLGVFIPRTMQDSKLLYSVFSPGPEPADSTAYRARSKNGKSYEDLKLLPNHLPWLASRCSSIDCLSLFSSVSIRPGGIAQVYMYEDFVADIKKNEHCTVLFLYSTNYYHLREYMATRWSQMSPKVEPI